MDSRERTWHGLQAAALSIAAGVGHLYLGEKRGYGLVLCGAALLIVSRLLWPPAELLYISLAIFSAFDAYGIAKRGHGLF
ncbi:MAG: hypothetical protein ACREJU_18040 [Nitrospiraceae bacterium]